MRELMMADWNVEHPILSPANWIFALHWLIWDASTLAICDTELWCRSTACFTVKSPWCSLFECCNDWSLDNALCCTFLLASQSTQTISCIVQCGSQGCRICGSVVLPGTFFFNRHFYTINAIFTRFYAIFTQFYVIFTRFNAIFAIFTLFFARQKI